MTTNPSIPIPEAAIEAGAVALDDVLTEHDLLRYGATMQRLIVASVLRAAFPHLVGELDKDLRLAEHALGKAVTCLERHIEADADTYGTHVLLRKVWDHIHDKVEALRTLEGK